MPPKSPYKFTKPQHEYLKTQLELYMVALQAEDSVKEITSTIDAVYDALVKQFKLGEQGKKEKDAIRMVRWSTHFANRNKEIYSLCSLPVTVAHDVVQL